MSEVRPVSHLLPSGKNRKKDTLKVCIFC